MAWIELHQSAFRHPKTNRAAAMLHKPRVVVVGHLAALWCWALDAAPEGGPLTEADVKLASEWTGKASALVEALVEVGYLERRDDGLWLHNWSDYAGKLLARREANKERMKRARAGHVQDTNGARAPATVPNPTNPTQPTQPTDQRSGRGSNKSLSQRKRTPDAPASPDAERETPKPSKARRQRRTTSAISLEELRADPIDIIAEVSDVLPDGVVWDGLDKLERIKADYSPQEIRHAIERTRAAGGRSIRYLASVLEGERDSNGRGAASGAAEGPVTGIAAGIVDDETAARALEAQAARQRERTAQAARVDDGAPEG